MYLCVSMQITDSSNRCNCVCCSIVHRIDIGSVAGHLHKQQQQHQCRESIYVMITKSAKFLSIAAVNDKVYFKPISRLWMCNIAAEGVSYNPTSTS